MQSSYVFLAAMAICRHRRCEHARRSDGAMVLGTRSPAPCAARAIRIPPPSPTCLAHARAQVHARVCHANAGGKQLQEAREDNVRAYPITKIIAPLALPAPIALSQ
jgi:hypothetical protein